MHVNQAHLFGWLKASLYGVKEFCVLLVSLVLKPSLKVTMSCMNKQEHVEILIRTNVECSKKFGNKAWLLFLLFFFSKGPNSLNYYRLFENWKMTFQIT